MRPAVWIMALVASAACSNDAATGKGTPVLPRSVLDLPRGNAEAGQALYFDGYYCVRCHGHPLAPGSNLQGPDLSTIATEAATRQPDTSAEQYVYDAIVRPQELIPESVQDSIEMPRVVVNAQHASDLVAFLMATGD